MRRPQEGAKEIRLFGEKSVREEAYRQKILQLEKEMSRLEAIAKISDPSASLDTVSESSPVHLEGLYHDSLLSFDKKVKKEHDFLERRASEIVERLNLYGQQIISNIDSTFHRKLKWLTVSGILAMAVFVILISAVIFSRDVPLTGGGSIFAAKDTGYIDEAEVLHKRLSYIKKALETQTVYRNQYSVDYIDLLSGIYIAKIELNFLPTDRWSLNKLSSDLVKVFSRYNKTLPAEFSFSYDGKTYLKVSISGSPQKAQHLYYF